MQLMPILSMFFSSQGFVPECAVRLMEWRGRRCAFAFVAVPQGSAHPRRTHFLKRETGFFVVL
jgi:hypothetical protein